MPTPVKPRVAQDLAHSSPRKTSGLFDKEEPTLSPRDIKNAARAKVLKWQTTNETDAESHAPAQTPDASADTFASAFGNDERPARTAAYGSLGKNAGAAVRNVLLGRQGQQTNSPGRRIVSEGLWKETAQSPGIRESLRAPSGGILMRGTSIVPPTKAHDGAWVRVRPAKAQPAPINLSPFDVSKPESRQSKSPPKPEPPTMGVLEHGSAQRHRNDRTTTPTESPERSLRRPRSREGPRRQQRPRSVASSYNDDYEHELAQHATTPPAAFGSRLEAWLSNSADPFVDAANQATVSMAARADSRNPVSPTRVKGSPRLHRHDEYVEKDLIVPRLPFTRTISYETTPRCTIRRIVETSGARSPRVEESPPPSLRQKRPQNRSPASPTLYIPHKARQPSTSDPLGLIETKREASITHDERRDGETVQALEDQAQVNDKCLDLRTIKQQRRLTTNDDLLSVLSMPLDNVKAIPSARSLRAPQSRLSISSTAELLDELRLEETKYMRELHTLVDGVIPVLLSCALSKSKSSVTAGLFGSGANQSGATTPIIDMGIASERLKSTHSRIPSHSVDSLILWARGAHRVYEDYLKAWKLGFQDVIVNLAPSEAARKNPQDIKANESGWDDGLARNANGDVVNNDGERVDVAFLMRRPLVRVKRLAKLLETIARVQPSEQASVWASKYNELVEEVRKRQDEERARLEDEAAASIDATRAREPSSLAPAPESVIDKGKCVRARDFFDMKLQHSSGQRIDCRVEFIIRDNLPGDGHAGDLLVCEVDDTSRWLLFPPLPLTRVSARRGEREGELVAMIRGQLRHGDWYEVLSLQSDDNNVAIEWVDMLGSNPLPPEVASTAKFRESGRAISMSRPPVVTDGFRGRTASTTTGLEVPLGEQPGWLSRVLLGKQPSAELDKVPGGWPEDAEEADKQNRASSLLQVDKTPRLRKVKSAAALQASSRFDSRYSPSTLPIPDVPRDLNEAMRVAGSGALLSGAFRTLSGSGHASAPPSPTMQRRAVSSILSFTGRRPSSGSRSITPGDTDTVRSTSEMGYKLVHSTATAPVAPYPRTSLLPSANAPLVQKRRSVGGVHSAPSTPATIRRKELSSPSRSVSPTALHPASPPYPMPPFTPRTQVRVASSPHIGYPDLSPVRQKRASSPLKRQYAPSEGSTSSSDDSDASSDDDESVTSESSMDDAGLASYIPLNTMRKPTLSATPSSIFSAKAAPSITPSQSASQAAYSSAPAVPSDPFRTTASIFCWSDKGAWESLHPHECTILVTPGLIEAYDPADPTAQPLIALDLTPLVPLRRGTAIDISVRSPPTPQSQLRCGANVMFRARTGADCEQLYARINHARINNPTYLALEAARGPRGDAHWAAYMQRRAARRAAASSSWWRFGSRRGSYRAGGSSRPRSAAASQSHTDGSGSAAAPESSSAASALDLARSIPAPRAADATPSRSDASLAGPDPTPSTPTAAPASPAAAPAPAPTAPLGRANIKIRLYRRENATKWRDMGAARLTVLHPAASSGIDAQSPARLRRILIQGKTANETLLDETLGEAAFERVARTGVAVCVREGLVGPDGREVCVADTGGVGAGRGRVYMVQCKNEAEAAYTFSLVGRQRY